MATATKLLSVPEAFSYGNFELWLRKFELCSTANGWKEDEMLKPLSTLLSGKAFAVFERLREDEKESFKTLVDAIKEAFGGDATLPWWNFVDVRESPRRIFKFSHMPWKHCSVEQCRKSGTTREIPF